MEKLHREYIERHTPILLSTLEQGKLLYAIRDYICSGVSILSITAYKGRPLVYNLGLYKDSFTTGVVIHEHTSTYSRAYVALDVNVQKCYYILPTRADKPNYRGSNSRFQAYTVLVANGYTPLTALLLALIIEVDAENRHISIIYKSPSTALLIGLERGIGFAHNSTHLVVGDNNTITYPLVMLDIAGNIMCLSMRGSVRLRIVDAIALVLILYSKGWKAISLVEYYNSICLHKDRLMLSLKLELDAALIRASK